MKAFRHRDRILLAWTVARSGRTPPPIRLDRPAEALTAVEGKAKMVQRSSRCSFLASSVSGVRDVEIPGRTSNRTDSRSNAATPHSDCPGRALGSGKPVISLGLTSTASAGKPRRRSAIARHKFHRTWPRRRLQLGRPSTRRRDCCEADMEREKTRTPCLVGRR
jgi:hypothetical protein